MADLEERVRTIVAEHLEVPESTVTLEASFVDDLGADSLDRIELVIAFEEAFSIDIPDKVADTLVNAGTVLAYVKGELCTKP
jgi:acyl carrier protein